MVQVTFSLPFLLVVFLLEQTNTVSYNQCAEMQSEVSRLRKLNRRNELLLGECYVSGYYTVNMSSLWYSYM
jgi:hypothetical protein